MGKSVVRLYKHLWLDYVSQNMKRFGNIVLKTYIKDISEMSTSVYRSAHLKCFAGTFSKQSKEMLHWNILKTSHENLHWNHFKPIFKSLQKCRSMYEMFCLNIFTASLKCFQDAFKMLMGLLGNYSSWHNKQKVF